VRVIQELLKPGMTFVDVGAHVGQYSLLASGLVGREGPSTALSPSLRPLLCCNTTSS
jgi:hypothetical protein